jgi:hypothetical protein
MLAAFIGLAVLVYSRVHYAPKYLFFFDNANFAFALRHFDSAKHQPQPPGYPMFVALLHTIDIVRTTRTTLKSQQVFLALPQL